MARYQILHCQPHRNWMLIMVLKMRDFTFIPSEAAKEPGFQAFRTITSGSRLTLELRPKSHELLPRVARMQISMSQNTRWDTVSIDLTGTSINHLVTPWWVKSPSIYHGVFNHHHHRYHYFYCFCFFLKTFLANSDRYTVVSHDLPKPIRTRYLRIVPEEWYSYIALRAEFYGCKTSEIKYLACINSFMLAFSDFVVNNC